MTTNNPNRHVRLLSMLLLTVAGSMGCSKSREPLYPVRGQVLYKDKPVRDALVVFHPQEGQAAAGPKPISWTNEYGSFVLSSHQRGDGAPAGVYRITVELREWKQVGEEPVRAGRPLLPIRYRSAATTGLLYRVEERDNDLGIIRLEDP